MSLELSECHGITVKTGVSCSCCGPVNIYRPKYAASPKFPAFDAAVTMGDFFSMAQYVLENTPLNGKNDPREAFLKYAQQLTVKNVPREGRRICSKG
jgi:hypothetical protein